MKLDCTDFGCYLDECYLPIRDKYLIKSMDKALYSLRNCVLLQTEKDFKVL